MEWTKYDDVEVDPEKVSGAPVLKGTRVPVDAIVDNFDGFMEEGLNESESALETLSCFPTVELNRIRALISYRDAHDHELQT